MAKFLPVICQWISAGELAPESLCKCYLEAQDGISRAIVVTRRTIEYLALVDANVPRTRRDLPA